MSLPHETPEARAWAEAFAARSGVTVEWLRAHGREVRRCDCEDVLCEGFQMAHVCEDALTTVARLVELLNRYRLPFGQELAMQEAVALVLTTAGVPFSREHDLGPGVGRIDFFLEADGIGLELKVKGSPGEVAAQLYRYAKSPAVHALILVSGRVRLGALPSAIAGKPLTVVGTWRSGL